MITVARFEDLRKVVPVVREALEEVQYHEPMVDGFFALRWAGLMESGKAITLVSEQDGEVAGIMLGMVCPDMFAPVTYAADLLWYVRPKYRSRGVGRDLVRAYETAARNRGCKRVVLGAWEKFNPDKTSGTLARLGYRPLERYLIKDL